MPNEKRKHQRFTIEQFVEFSYAHRTSIKVEGVNLSEGGILCKTTYPVDPLNRAFIMLNMSLKGRDYILKLNGVIAHYQKKDNFYLFGVQFTDVSEEDRNILREYLGKFKSVSN